MAQVVAICNHKGGVGKTTTTASLGACLAEMGHSTLLVDLDSQAHLTLSSGLTENDLEWTVVDLLSLVAGGSGKLSNLTHGNQADPGVDIGALIRTTAANELDILPADIRLIGVERALYDLDRYEAILARSLVRWHDQYAYVLLDCPPSLSAVTLMALTAAHVVLIPVQCEYFAVRGLTRLLDVVVATRERTNPNLTYQVLATMYDGRNRICRGVLKRLREYFPDEVCETFISVDTRLRECPVVGEPITTYAPRTRATRQYRALAHEFVASTSVGGN